MARSFRTRPLKARRDEHVEHHDHSKGECDLLPFDEWYRLPKRKRWRRNCSWWWQYPFRDTRYSDKYYEWYDTRKGNRMVRHEKVTEEGWWES